MPRPLSLLIFDFDGTLVDSMQLGYHLFQVAAEKYHFKRPQNYAEYQHLLQLSPPQLVWKLRISPMLIQHVVHDMFQAGLEDLLACPLFPGMREVIEQLHQRYLLAIVSSNLTTAVQAYLDAHHLAPFFHFILGTSKVESKKHKLLACLRQCHVPASEALFVGDSYRDVLDAQHVGIPIVAVSYGIHESALLQSVQPNMIVDHPRELTTAITTIAAQLTMVQ